MHVVDVHVRIVDGHWRVHAEHHPLVLCCIADFVAAVLDLAAAVLFPGSLRWMVAGWLLMYIPMSTTKAKKKTKTDYHVLWGHCLYCFLCVCCFMCVCVHCGSSWLPVLCNE